MAKKNFHLALDPEVHKRIRAKARDLRLSAGDVIEAYLDTVDALLAVAEDPEFARRAAVIHTDCLHRVGWSPFNENEEAEIQERIDKLRASVEASRKLREQSRNE